jgi:anti-anti-sigma factor
MENLHLNCDHGVLCAAWPGEITLEITQDLRRALWDEAEADHVRGLVLDLSQVSFIDSSGIALLVALDRNLEAAGKKLVLVGLPERIRRTLELVGVMRVLTVADDQDQARSMLPGAS